jgi:thioredoxin 1
MASEIDEAAFEATVLKSATPVLVDFFATWCAPCMAQGPILEKWASARQDKVKVVKLNVDNAANVASQFGVMSIPTLVVFKGGKEVARAVGRQQEKALDALLAKAGG